MHTLDYDLSQLNRLYDLIDSGQHVRIIHILAQDDQGVEDRYIVLVDCDPATYTLLLLL